MCFQLHRVRDAGLANPARPLGKSASGIERNSLTHERPHQPAPTERHRAGRASRAAGGGEMRQVSGMNRPRPGRPASGRRRIERGGVPAAGEYSAWSVFTRWNAGRAHPVYRAATKGSRIVNIASGHSPGPERAEASRLPTRIAIPPSPKLGMKRRSVYGGAGGGNNLETFGSWPRQGFRGPRLPEKQPMLAGRRGRRAAGGRGKTSAHANQHPSPPTTSPGRAGDDRPTPADS